MPDSLPAVSSWDDHYPMRHAAPPPSPTSDAVTPKLIVHALRRWWKLATVLGVALAAIAGSIAYFTYVPIYEAETWLRISPEGVLYQRSKAEIDLFIQNQIEMIKSPPILNEALANPAIANQPMFEGMKDPDKWLRENLKVGTKNQSELFVISLRSPHREAVYKVVNAVREAYLDNLNNDVAEHNANMLQVLETLKNERFNEIKSDRDKLMTLTRESRSGHTGWVGSADSLRLSTPVPEFEVQLTRAELDLTLAEAEYRLLEEKLASSKLEVPEDILFTYAEQEPEIRALVSKIDQEKLRIESMKVRLVPTSKKILAAEQSLTKLQEALEQKRGEIIPTIKERAEADYRVQQQAQLKQMESALESRRLARDVLAKKLDESRRELQAVSENSLTVKFMQDDLARKESIYQQISNRFSQIQTESKGDSKVFAFAPAEPPVDPIDDGPLMLTLMAAAAAFVVPFIFACLWEIKTRPVADTQDLVSATHLRVVGEVTRLPTRPLLPTTNGRYEQGLSEFEESIEYLRTTLTLSRQTGDNKIIVVCSAGSREGKSTVASHLASSTARSLGTEGKVLLVDMDLRRPRLHTIFKMDPDPGIVQYLAGHQPWRDLRRPTSVANLDFISAGWTDAPVAILLNGRLLRTMFDEMKEEYEVVIVDVPPILPVSDGVTIARAADSAILCGLRDVSSANAIAKACGRLTDAGVNLLGTVLNGVPNQSSSNRYTYGSYYHQNRPKATNV